ncbi:PPOX class F420-dependent oxidoreductase [uncultured Jatrophihabitans sp.]|uniref:PPOX class F420-dependent oxidoreductase n=1 Tax=uncultured Jatrophihabitans sp. TaxID=1610747 RepID=UPI0035CBD9B6
MDTDAARAFLRTNHRAVLATVRKDGRPAMSPVTASVDGEGRAVISTRETAMKVQHIRRNPLVSLCAFTEGFFGEWVQVEGTAEIVTLPEAMDLLVDYYRDVAGEHEDWDDYRAAMQRERRVIVRVEIQRAGPNVQG